ncbi:MAG: hypothetical protein PUE33_02920 [bacterium]|nr:hypothetical protein [Mycoplasmatota bacterium]MDD6757004.1 hypothetical protein [bacterium]
MNETIGEKGGRRDRKRTIIITSENKKKLKEYYKKKKKLKLEKLEREVKNLQLASFLVAVPISIAGNIYDAMFHVIDETKEEEKEKGLQKELRDKAKGLQVEELHQTEKLELSETSTYIEDYQTNDRKFTDYGYPKTIEGKMIVSLADNKKLNSVKTNIEITLPPQIAKTQVSLTENNKLGKKEDILNQTNQESKIEVLEEKQDTIPMPAAGMSFIENTVFQKAQDKTLVVKYEEKFKDIREELKELIYEYNVLAQETNDIYTSKEAENILHQLNMVIKKLEELKGKIKVEVADLENENYLIELVDGYIESFKNKKIVDEVKDSALYIMLADKVEELTTKTGSLNTKLEDKKEELELDEEKIETLKDAYYNYDNFNNQLISFQYEQDFMLKELEQRVQESTSITEQVEYRIQLMTKQSKRLLKMLALPMMIPGGRSAKAMATATAAYMYFMKNLMNPRLQQKKYRIISVTDYSREIENNISKVSDAINLIGKTSDKLEEMITKLEKDFKDYIDEIPECKELLSNLNKLLSELKQKEEELVKTKSKQENLLEKNNQKVKTLERVEEV